MDAHCELATSAAREIFHGEVEVWMLRKRKLKICVSGFKVQKGLNTWTLHLKPPLQPTPHTDGRQSTPCIVGPLPEVVHTSYVLLLSSEAPGLTSNLQS